jgi:hypothetical protein
MRKEYIKPEDTAIALPNPLTTADDLLAEVLRRRARQSTQAGEVARQQRRGLVGKRSGYFWGDRSSCEVRPEEHASAFDPCLP